MMRDVLKKVLVAMLAVAMISPIGTTAVKADEVTTIVLNYELKTYTRQLYGPDVDQIKAGVDTAGLLSIGELVDNLNFVSNGTVKVDRNAVMSAVKNCIVAGQKNITIDMTKYTEEAIKASKIANAAGNTDNVQTASSAMLVQADPIALNKTLNDMGIDCKISEGTTKFNPNLDRAVNVRNAASKINGMIIQPGQMFSADLFFLPRTKANGYGLGDIIDGNKHVKGMGGGVCQVSSTLNLAVLGAGIIPTERHNHSQRSAYIGSGLDATISAGSYDYKFINTLAYPIYIATNSDGGRLTISFYSNHNALGGVLYKPEVVGNKTYVSGYVNGTKIVSNYAYSSKYK